MTDESSTPSDAREVLGRKFTVRVKSRVGPPSRGEADASGWRDEFLPATPDAIIAALSDHVREHGPLPLGDDCVVVATSGEAFERQVDAAAARIWESECDEFAEETGHPRSHYKTWDQAKGAARDETLRRARAVLAAVGTEPREEKG